MKHVTDLLELETGHLAGSRLCKKMTPRWLVGILNDTKDLDMSMYKAKFDTVVVGSFPRKR